MRALYTKLAFQDLSTTFVTLASKDLWLRIKSQSISSSRILKDATSEHGRINQTSRRDQEIEFLQWIGRQKLRRTKYFMATTGSYPEKNSLEVKLYASRRGRKEHLKRYFFILKSLDSGNLWRRLKESMKALSSCCSLEHISLKER